jgi:hypothetical protein
VKALEATQEPALSEKEKGESMGHLAMPSKKIGRPRPVGTTPHVSREEFLWLHERVEETIAAIERLQHDYGIQVQRTAELQATIDRLAQQVQALTTALGRPRETK